MFTQLTAQSQYIYTKSYFIGSKGQYLRRDRPPHPHPSLLSPDLLCDITLDGNPSCTKPRLTGLYEASVRSDGSLPLKD